jgi:hypothetical protein
MEIKLLGFKARVPHASVMFYLYCFSFCDNLYGINRFPVWQLVWNLHVEMPMD